MSVTSICESEKHSIFDEDPGDLIHYVYKEISIISVDGLSHQGWVYTVDPVSLSFGLVQFSQRQASKIELVMGHAIKQVSIINDDVDTYREQLDSLFKCATGPADSSLEVASRREKVVSWLVRNRIPVQTCSDQPGLLSIGDVLYIHPPFLAEDCQSSNEIVLGKIQGLLRNMPDIVTEKKQ